MAGEQGSTMPYGYDVGYGTNAGPGGYDMSGYMPTGAGAYGGGGSQGNWGQMGQMANGLGSRGGTPMGAAGLAGIGGGIYSLLNSPQYFDYLQSQPYLQGNIATMQGLSSQFSNPNMPQYQQDQAMVAARRANASQGITGGLGASVEAQTGMQANQMWNQWRIQQLMQIQQQMGAMQAAQAQRDAAIKAGRMNAEASGWNSILGGVQMMDPGQQMSGMMGSAGGGGGGGGVGALVGMLAAM